MDENGSKRRLAWDIFQIVVPVAQAILLALLTLFTSDLSERVSHALQERQLDLSNIEAMKDLILKVQSKQAATDEEEAEAAAVALAAFGARAVPPLINVIQSGNETGNTSRVQAAEKGLRAIGWVDQNQVCPQMARIIENRSALFSWGTHLSAIRLLGDLECADALPGLVKYRDKIASATLEQFAKLINASPAPSLNCLQQIKTKLSQTIAILQRTEEPAS